MGCLYIVATPIGNLEDITLRATRILSEVDLILCEDTRRTIKLLNSLDIKNKLISFNKNNELEKTPIIIDKLKSNNYALVSDAGTPTISDPGSKLVRKALENNIKVIPVPGASSLLTAYSVSGITNNDFIFQGFPPRRKKEAEIMLLNLKNLNKDVIFFESPKRIEVFIERIMEIFPNSRVIIFRELTKMYEEILIRKPNEGFPKINNLKGEFVVIIEREKLDELASKKNDTTDEIILKLKEFISMGLSGKDSVRNTSEYLGLSNKKIYNIYINEVLKPRRTL
jgi:16S rRNA (cytidine1402-2'-O)-methyltransferase